MRKTIGRWAAILLPIVVIARALLLAFQIGSEHDAPELASEPASELSASPGEVLRFRPGRRAWAADDGWRPFVAAMASKNGVDQPPDTACLLDPDVMNRHGGRLTLRSRTQAGTWTADWAGHRTTRTRDEVPEVEPDPAIRAQEAAILDGADCGEAARLELSDSVVQALLDFLAGREPTVAALPPREGLNIRAVSPEAPP